MADLYKPSTWINNEQLNADKLNHLERGLEKATKQIGTGGITIDSSLSSSSLNPVQNKVITKSLSDLDKDFSLVVKHTVTADDGEASLYFSKTYIEDDNGVATTGADFDYKDMIITVNIPIIDSASTTNFGGTHFALINTSNVSAGQNRVSAFSATWRENVAMNIAIRLKIEGGRVFSYSGCSSGNTSNIVSTYDAYCNRGTVQVSKINSVLYHIFSKTLPKGTVIQIYAR